MPPSHKSQNPTGKYLMGSSPMTFCLSSRAPGRSPTIFGFSPAIINSMTALGEYDEAFRRRYPYLAAHIDLYGIHHAPGHAEEARHYFAKAIVPGAIREEL